MTKKSRFGWAIAAVLVIGLVAFLVMKPKPPLPGEIVSIELFGGQGKILETLIIGKLTDPDGIKQFQTAFNQGKKNNNMAAVSTQLPDYDIRVTPKEGDPYLLHLWRNGEWTKFTKSVMRNGSYTLDPAPYMSKSFLGDINKALALFPPAK